MPLNVQIGEIMVEGGGLGHRGWGLGDLGFKVGYGTFLVHTCAVSSSVRAHDAQQLLPLPRLQLGIAEDIETFPKL